MDNVSIRCTQNMAVPIRVQWPQVYEIFPYFAEFENES